MNEFMTFCIEILMYNHLH